MVLIEFPLRLESNQASRIPVETTISNSSVS